jgi:hypothetical protein
MNQTGLARSPLACRGPRHGHQNHPLRAAA